jgi:phage terminase small subunit
MRTRCGRHPVCLADMAQQLQRRVRKDLVARAESGRSDEGTLHLTCIARSEVRSAAEHGLERVGFVGGDDGTDLASEVDD